MRLPMGQIPWQKFEIKLLPQVVMAAVLDKLSDLLSVFILTNRYSTINHSKLGESGLSA